MEKIKQEAYFNGGAVFLQKYDIPDISGLEEGMLFGTITSTHNIHNIYPTYTYNDGQLENGMEYIGCDFSGTKYDDAKEMPLIFKKLDGNRAQEILSGEIFVVSTEPKELEGFKEFSRTPEEFKEDLKKYSEENIIIEATADDYSGEVTSPAIFEVNDEFKSLYNAETLKNKDEVVGLLGYAKEQGHNLFNESLREYMDEVHSIADTDNLLYDIEHSSKKM